MIQFNGCSVCYVWPAFCYIIIRIPVRGGQSVCLSLRPSIRLARRVSNAVEIVEKPESDSSGEDRYCDEGDSKMRSYLTNSVQ